jgi:O-acetyl-ADP-ribose deacetylase (regulator of RNase III)
MIEFIRGDILKADVEAIVNTVNCVGVMGRGIALQMKNAFPENFRTYEAACRREELEPGRMHVFETGQLTNPRYIINFPTKRHWRGKSRLSDIESGLQALISEVKRLGIRSIAIPPLGCGLGGLDWQDVRPRIEAALRELPDVFAQVFEPAGAPEAAQMAKPAKVPSMTPGRAALIGLMHRYLGGLMDPFVTLLEVHKLAYFMEAAGEPLNLSYVKGRYGPYAEKLRHVLRHIEGHFISGYADGADRPDVRLELVPGAVTDATRFLETHPATRGRFDRVGELVEGFETPFGLELLSSVHWVATREGATNTDETVSAVYGWAERKHQFTPEQIDLARDVLASQGWIGPEENRTARDSREA